MKTAILMPGFLRSYKETIVNFKERVIKPFKELGEVDVFCSTWINISPEHFGATHHKQIINPDKLYNVDLEEFRLLFNPTALETEDFEKCKSFLKLDQFCDVDAVKKEIWSEKEWFDGILHTTCQFYKIYKTNLLKKQYEQKNGFIYDYVLKYRSDALAPKVINLDLFLKDTLYLVDGSHESKMINDTIWLSNSEMNDYICNLYNNFNYFYSNAKELGHCFVIEKILYQYIHHLFINSKKMAEFGVLNAKWTWCGRNGVN